MTTADMDARDRNQGYERRMRIALQAIRDNQQWEIAYAALQEILESPVENSHGLARIALDRIKAL